MKPTLSVVIPIHDMQGGAEFLWRTVNVLMYQTFQDFEIVITKRGTMPENTNAGIKRARGELIKILYLDDCLAYPDALKDIVDAFTPQTEWLITGTDNNPEPYWTDDIETGNNKLGSPSALTIRNHGLDTPLFDEQMTWLLDCDYYRRLYDSVGPPLILPGANVNIGVGEHQVSYLLSDEAKEAEHDYMKTKYGK
jgi:hypothetical protein